jgi:hypothetical protein
MNFMNIINKTCGAVALVTLMLATGNPSHAISRTLACGENVTVADLPAGDSLFRTVDIVSGGIGNSRGILCDLLQDYLQVNNLEREAAFRCVRLAMNSNLFPTDDEVRDYVGRCRITPAIIPGEEFMGAIAHMADMELRIYDASSPTARPVMYYHTRSYHPNVLCILRDNGQYYRMLNAPTAS